MNQSSTMAALRLTVNNHPGLTSHVCGLFARRAYNMEAFFGVPIKDNSKLSRIWILISLDEKGPDSVQLQQIVRQVQKLHDVLDVQVFSTDHNALLDLEQSMLQWENGLKHF